MHDQDLRFYLYRASDIIKRPIGAYCAQLYREGVGDNEYLDALRQHYKALNPGRFNASTLDDLLEAADTRAWFKLVRQHLHDKLKYFVPKSSRDLAKHHAAALLKAYNAAYHQQPFDRPRAQEAVQTTLTFMRLINVERAEEPIKTQLKSACVALEALVAELYVGEDQLPSNILSPLPPQTLLPQTAAPPAVLPPSKRGIVTIQVTSLTFGSDPDDQHTAQVQPPSLYTLHIVAPDGRIDEYPLHQDEITIGRSPQANLKIEDPKVSRLHLRINLRGQLTLTDLGSTGGTKLENELVPSNTPIPWEVGKPIFIGNTRLMLKWTM